MRSQRTIPTRTKLELVIKATFPLPPLNPTSPESESLGSGVIAQIPKIDVRAADRRAGRNLATVVFESPNAIPSTVNLPVMFVLGSGTITGDTVIGGVVNAASLAPNVSPGMITRESSTPRKSCYGRVPFGSLHTLP